MAEFKLESEYNPTGDRRLAQAEINKTIQGAEEEIIELIKSKLEKMPL